jgi:hypothetical protein
VTYYWLRTDTTGTHTQPQHTVNIAKGDTGTHNVVTDKWTPAGSGSEKLVFVSPSYAVSAQSFSCNGNSD